MTNTTTQEPYIHILYFAFSHVQTNRESSRIEKKPNKSQKPRAAKLSFTDFLALIWRLLFFKPVWTKENQNRCNIRFIYVNFNAWHFSGSDLLWAGIVIRLFNAIQVEFGKLHLALFRVAQYDEKDEIKEKEVVDGPNNWIWKKVCCCPVWCFILVLLAVPAVLLVLFFVSTKAEVKPEEQGTEDNSELGVWEGFLIASLGIPATAALKFVFQMLKNLIFSQADNIKKGMDTDRMSSQLGFMNNVRKEILTLIQFIKFMEVFERRRIRVVLKITNLDRCSPQKIVGVLEAINLLLSVKESPVLSILAVDSHVLLEKVKFAESCFCKEDRAHALLNRIVTLVFTVPPRDEKLKRSLFHCLTERRISKRRRSSMTLSVVDVEESMESHPLVSKATKTLDMKDKPETMVEDILKKAEQKLNKFMIDDTISMKRLINSVRVNMIIMKNLKIEFPNQEHTVAWVVLGNQWPCRFSWIIQCVKDEEQRAGTDQQNAESSKDLWDVFNESREELYVMRSHIEDLLQQDGDPELFEELLADKEFEFTVKNLKLFQKVMVNLDHSVRRELALLRGTSRLKDSSWNIAPLPVATLIKMTTKDICEEMKRMKLESKYIETVEHHKLDGSALVFGDAEDLKGLLDMTFGEWTTFKLRFLSFVSPLRPQHENTMQFPHKRNFAKVPPPCSP